VKPLAYTLVTALLEAEDDFEFDPKSYALHPSVVHHHEVWSVTTKEIRQLLRPLGWKVTSQFRRKRGSLGFILAQIQPQWPVAPETEAERVRYSVDEYLAKKFNVGGRGSPFWVHAWVWDARLELEIGKGGTESPYD